MQTNNRIFDDLAGVLTDAVGVAKGARDEVSQLLRQQGERVATDLALASQEELEVTKDLVRQALSRLDALDARLARLEALVPGPDSDAETHEVVVENATSTPSAE